MLQKQHKGPEALSQLHLNLFCTWKNITSGDYFGKEEGESAPGLAPGQVLQDNTLTLATVFR